MKIIPKKISGAILAFVALGLIVAVLTIFFDQAVLMRPGTFYQGHVTDNVVALTFDDGPSPVWTPQILDALKAAGVKATFFMIGDHVQRYPEIARRVAAEGHEIGNHTDRHHVLFFTDGGTMKKEIAQCQNAIREATGVTTNLFRPPKAWLTPSEKRKIRRWGYRIILWTLNSKDWVMFDDKYIVRYLDKNAQPGDIILFHDSGGAFGFEGGDRHETVLALPRIIEKLREREYRFLTVSELLELEQKSAPATNP